MIVRSPRPEANFTQLRNDVLRDGRLSFRARGVLGYLLSLPDNWRTSSDEIAKHGTEGRDAIRTALAELEAAKYLERRRDRDPKTGQIATVTFVYDKPQLAPATENPAPEDPTVGQPADGSPGDGKSGALETSETNTEKNKNPPSPEVTVIVDQLARKVAAHSGHRPKTAAWSKPIDLLLRRGHPDWADPAPIPPREVIEMIELVFSAGAVKSGRGFCWADQVRSGEALRRHWLKLCAWRDRETSRPAGNVDAVDEVFAAYESAGRAPGETLGL